ncbi:MAG: zinc-ribbon domain-containing protein [Planctomycetia bacterium]|nr:zinc-ribbon domain-containing protein [Planctomycetia bacterium]
MSAIVEIPCPSCEEPLRVPETVFGKKIKCKHCGHMFVVEVLDDDEEPKPKKGAVKPSKPGGSAKPKAKEEPKPEPAPTPTPPKKPYEDDDDEGANPNPFGVVDAGEDIPRCPHCAKELDPPDAVICIHCGFNNVTRTKVESKKVWAPDATDWMSHLGPGIAALLAAIGLIVLDVICWVNMSDWLTGTFLEKDEKDAAGQTAFYVKPGAFIALIIAITIMPIIGFARFAIKRLAIEYTPTEKVKK